jgi:excisionase family DNA binding protein
MSEFYTVQELANILKLSPQTIRRFEKNGDLQCVRFGDTLRFSAEVVEQFVRQGKQSNRK